MDRACGRLAVISAHLVASDVINISNSLEAFPVFSNAMVRQAVKLGGTLKVTDERNGKEYKLVIKDDGTVMASDFKKISVGNNKWITLYDPGYINTAPAHSAICYIDGEESILRYRGYPIQDLANRSTYPEVAFLLIYGCLPSSWELRNWEYSISQQSPIPEGVLNIIKSAPPKAHPMCVLLSALSQLSVCFPGANPTIKGQGLYKSKKLRDEQIVRVLGMVPTIVATIYSVLKGENYVLPSKSFSYTENFLYMLDSKGVMINCRPKAKLVQILDILFILHAEHGMDSSTAAARHLASTGVNVYAVLAGAAGALYGPLHGGANEAAYKMLAKIEYTHNIPQFIEDVKNGKCKLSGFGHRVYKNQDPRVEIVHRLIKEVSSVLPSNPLLEFALEVEKAARKDEYFIKRNLYPNVHFYTAILYSVMGFEERFFTLFFAVPRMAGFLAHWLESLDDPDTKIIRPPQVYSGKLLQEYVPINERKTEAGKFVHLQKRP